MNPTRLIHTVVWLKPRQIMWQVLHRARRILPSRHVARGSARRDSPEVRWRPVSRVMGQGMRRHDPDSTVSGILNFLNEPFSVGFPPIWDAHGPSKLWLYNLHYCEYIWGLPLVSAKELALNWIDQYPYRKGRVGWDPYPLSLRIQNWCGYFLGLHLDDVRSDSAFLDRLLESIDEQVATLETNLEFHLLGNHLFENAATLVLAGACLSSPSAERQLASGIRLLEEQVGEQVLEDGGHFERSPMYHARLTYLLSQLASAGNEVVTRCVAEPLRKMQTALALMVHPDGEIALFNDSAFGIAPVPGDIGIHQAIPGPFALPDTGYFGSRTGRGDFIICDAGPIGPDYIPGHAHGDIFSFELSLAGSRVIVDSGVFGYEPDPMRAYCRSTRAHNTVEIAGVDQCEFWGTFRVARRGRPRGVTFEEKSDGFVLSGEHDGYARLHGKPIHRRMFRWIDTGILVVNDHLTSKRSVDYISRVHLHPDCEIIEIDHDRAKIRYPAGEFVIVWQGSGTLSTEDSWYCPEFGVRQQNVTLAFAATAPGQCSFCVAPDESSVTFAK